MLVKILNYRENIYVCWYAAESLGKIAPVGNKKAIKALVKILDCYRHWGICQEAAESLGKIAPVGNKKAIAALLQLLSSSEDEMLNYSDKNELFWICIKAKAAAKSLGKITPVGNKKVIASLVQLLHSSENKLSCWNERLTTRDKWTLAKIDELIYRTAESLTKIDSGNKEAIVSKNTALSW
ncbi:MAG: HEAT repeat domain-containing protein [Hormoscilla sp. GUM202]|nr:HEAT repeat domain-containing protein [Hormoscilla sp. GUM202]